MDVSKRIIVLRERCGLTQNGLAERAGVSQTHLRRVELGQADITIGHLQLLCDAMSISIQDFFQDKSNSDEIAVAFSKLSPKQKTLLLSFLESLQLIWLIGCIFDKINWTHHRGFPQNDVSNFFIEFFAELFLKSDRSPNYLLASSIATATATVIPTMGLLPAPMRPIIST